MAANPHKGEVDFEAGGKSYTMVFTTNAIVQAEQLLGAGIGEITAQLTRVENIRVLFWASLQKHHPKIDLLAAGDIFDEYDGGMNELADPLARALRFRISRVALDQPLVATEEQEA